MTARALAVNVVGMAIGTLDESVDARARAADLHAVARVAGTKLAAVVWVGVAGQRGHASVAVVRVSGGAILAVSAGGRDCVVVDEAAILAIVVRDAGRGAREPDRKRDLDGDRARGDALDLRLTGRAIMDGCFATTS